MPYDITAMREKLRASMSSRPVDPDEFRPPKSDGSIIKFRFFVLPPLQKGDICANGHASRNMDVFYVPYGHHWVDNRPHQCPRILSEGDVDCPMCQTGFDILKEMKAHKCTKDELGAAARQWLPSIANMVNIYFPAIKTNPEELHDQVKYLKSPQACFGHWRDCLERDDAGDPEEPEAFGAFFDELHAYYYELRVGKSGEYNEYKTSRFIATDKRGESAAMPIAMNAKGDPDMKAIQKILERRHDLWLKQGVADVAHMQKLVDKLYDGDDAVEEAEGGFDHDESKGRSRPGGKGTTGSRSATAVLQPPTAARSTRAPAAVVLDEEDELPQPRASKAAKTAVRPPKPEPEPEIEEVPDIDDEVPAPRSQKAAPVPAKAAEAELEAVGESTDDSTIGAMLDQLAVED